MSRSASLAGLGLLLPPILAWLSVSGYRFERDPQSFLASGGPGRWLVAPSNAAWAAAIDRRLEAAMEELNATDRAAADRLGAYRDELRAAGELLLATLSAQPAQPSALSQLAVVRWELGPPSTIEEQRALVARIAAAASLAPRVPAVQLRSGELLLKMGRRQEAVGYVRRAVELDPAFANKGVELMRGYLFSADEALKALPAATEVLLALEPVFRDEGRPADYMVLLERSLEHPSPALLARYGALCLELGRSSRLLERIEQQGPFAQAGLEAERRRQLSRARLALGDAERAMVEARLALELRPDDASFAEHLGRSSLAASDPAAAVAAFRQALARVAVESGDPRWRARLYAQIGTAEELRGAPDRAYDAYRKALLLDPQEPVARRRLTEMQGAAGASGNPP